MQAKGISSEAFRISISSAPTSSSQGSGQDVYVWNKETYLLFS